jgi:hypothetical protein
MTGGEWKAATVLGKRLGRPLSFDEFRAVQTDGVRVDASGNVMIPGTGHVLTRAEWEAAQTVPGHAIARALQSGEDLRTATTHGFGRPLTGEEWEKAQTMTPDQIRAWKIPLLPKPTIRRDVTITPADEQIRGKRIETPIVGALMRQLVNPVLEHPVASAPFLALAVPGAAAEAPVVAGIAAVTAGAAAVHTIARYGWQKAHELVMTPEERAQAEADPDRVSGEAAAVQAAMLGLAPLIHVATRTAKGPPRYLDTPNAARDVTAPQRGAAVARSDFAAMLERGAQQPAPLTVKPVKGLEPTVAEVKAGRVKPVEGLVVPETAKPGRVRPIDTESPLESVARARREDAMRPRRRPAPAEQAPFFETAQGAETLGAMAARHGLPGDANPYHPASPLSSDWQAGHGAATESYPVYPEGFTMGGALTDNRIPADYNPPTLPGLDATALPEGVTPETAQLAAALKPNRFRGHSTDELLQVARSAREKIDRAQSVITAGDAAPSAVTLAEKAATRANGTLAQVEREFALRGVTGDELARRVAGEAPPVPAAGGLEPIAGTGETNTRGLSAGIEEKAIANRLEVDFGHLPEYRVASMAEQAQMATALLRDDPALALRVAKGEAQPPRDLLPESVLVAVENRAIAEGDVNTLREIAHGKLAGQATTMGQRIRALAERDPDSAVGAIQEITNARGGSAVAAEKATSTEIARITDQVQSAPFAPNAWAEFVNSLKC